MPSGPTTVAGNQVIPLGTRTELPQMPPPAQMMPPPAQMMQEPVAPMQPTPQMPVSVMPQMKPEPPQPMPQPQPFQPPQQEDPQPAGEQHPQYPPFQPPQQEDPQPRRPSLEEWCQGLHTAEYDVQRQMDGFGFSRSTANFLTELQNNPGAWDNADPNKRPMLPFVSFTYPVTDGSTEPGRYKMDLNTLSAAQLVTMAPMFAMIATEQGGLLMDSVRAAHTATTGAMEIVSAAAQAQPQPQP